MPKMQSIKDFRKFENVLDYADPKIHFFGGRCVVYEGQEYTLKYLVKMLMNSKFEPKQFQALVGKVRILDERAQKVFKKTHIVRKLLTYIRQYFGNLFFNRNEELVKVEFGGKIPATSLDPFRLLVFRGEKGAVACRVRGVSASALPKLSKHSGFEFSARTALRARNLIAVRGWEPGTRMTGPADLYGNIEEPHKHLYTIHIYEDGIPVLLREKLPSDSQPKPITAHEAEEKAKLDPTPFTTRVDAKWYKGSDSSTKDIHLKYQEAVGPSIFPDSGILEIQGGRHPILKKVDARSLDLSSFKARLVNNQTPFQITSKKLVVKDEYRAVSYLYEPRYAENQVARGGGLFLETHQFVQTITPLDSVSKGFVTLARWADDTHKALEIIGIEIPAGYTLIIDEYSLHGDTNLNGMYMMCMTSYHVTMRTADTVFLKHAGTLQNINITLEDERDQSESVGAIAPRPISLYDGENTDSFKRHLDAHDVVHHYSYTHRVKV